LFLGLDVDGTGALIDRNGLRSEILYALGPVRKGTLWETTAVPEIRAQALHLARKLTTNGRPPIRPKLALLSEKEPSTRALSG